VEYLFRASKVKLKRALRFIDEVDTGLRAYDANSPISASLGPGGTLNIHFKEVDPDVLAALGDAIHNMRTALDLMASELARIKGQSDKNVYFPFADSKKNFPDKIKSKNFDRAGEDAVALIEQFEPYSDGNKMLRAIHDLDIRDKHSAILVTRRVTKDLKLSYRLDEGPNPAIAASGSNSHEFLDGPLSGQPLIETLKELVQLVDGIIEAFARMVELRDASGAV
jgi:hypothetical protein